MGKTACMILIISVLFCSLCLLQNSHASAPVSGVISTDTTWRASDSPIEFAGPVCINGATLTIEPGTTVDIKSFYLQVNGTLKAEGTNDNKIAITSDASNVDSYRRIQFTANSISWNEQTNSGSILENAVLNHICISIRDSSPKISNNVFKNVTDVSISASGNTAALIINNQISSQYNSAISANGQARVANNTIVGNGFQFGISAGENAVVTNNVVSYCWSAIRATGHATIEGNILVNNYNAGIECESNNVVISRNYIANRHYGLIGSGNIQTNTFTKNQIAIKDPSPSLTLTNNNIFDNSQNSIYLSTSSNIDASNNYWGTTDAQTINQTIHDFKNDFNLGKVNFTPFLSQQVDIGLDDNSIPPVTLTPAPTPTATSQTTFTPQPTTSAEATPDPNSFKIESNSTISAFAFDSNIPQISFTVNGPVGTSGYVKLAIAKSFMSKADTIQVYLDGNPINREVTSNGDSWIVTFTYHHSIHQVIINSAQASNTWEMPSWIWNAAIGLTAIGIAAAAVILVWSTKRKTRIDAISQP